MSKNQANKTPDELSKFLKRSQNKLIKVKDEMLGQFDVYQKSIDKKISECVDLFKIKIESNNESAKELYFEKRTEIKEDIRILGSYLTKLTKCILRKIKRQEKAKLKKLENRKKIKKSDSNVISIKMTSLIF